MVFLLEKCSYWRAVLIKHRCDLIREVSQIDRYPYVLEGGGGICISQVSKIFPEGGHRFIELEWSPLRR